MPGVQSAPLPNPSWLLRRTSTIARSVITENPFECVAYMTAGESHPAVENTMEAYTAKMVYQDAPAKTVWDRSVMTAISAGKSG